MDVRAKSLFSWPSDGEKLFDPQAFGRNGLDVRGKIRPKKFQFMFFLAQRKERKPRLLSPDIFLWGRGLPREGVGATKFGMCLKTREIKLSERDIPGFCWDIPAVPEKLRKRKMRVQFFAP